MNVINNKTKDESSRIFSTTESTSSDQPYVCEKHRHVCNSDKVINGLLDVIDRLQTENDYLGMAYEIVNDSVAELEKEIDSLETVAYETAWGEDL